MYIRVCTGGVCVSGVMLCFPKGVVGGEGGSICGRKLFRIIGGEYDLVCTFALLADMEAKQVSCSCDYVDTKHYYCTLFLF